MQLPIGDDGGFELSESKLEIINRCIEHADECFDGDAKRYGEVCWWDDGDFRLRIVHGKGGGEDDYYHHGEEVSFKASAGRIVYRDYSMDMLSRAEDNHEVRILEEIDIND